MPRTSPGVYRVNSPQQEEPDGRKVITCRVCKETKDVELFARDSAYIGGVSNRCRLCKAKRDRINYNGRKDRYKEWRRLRRLDKAKRIQDRNKSEEWRNRNIPKLLITSAKKGAEKRGLEFAISESDIEIPSHCPLLGIPLRRTLDNNRDTSPSLDRFDSTKGYVPGNIWVISYRANRIKNNATADELLLIGRKLKEFEDGIVNRKVRNPHPTYSQPTGRP